MKSTLIYSNIEDNNVQITFVIPTYLRNEYLNDAIISIKNIHGLKNINYEILVINNNPLDKMENLLECFSDLNISIYSNDENYGMIGNINQGVMLAKGEYISFLHDDDMLLENYLDSIINYISKSESKYDCIIPSRYLFDEHCSKSKKEVFLNIVFAVRHIYRKKLQRVKVKDFIYSSKNIYTAPTCGVIFRRSKLIEFGGFSEVNGLAWDYYNFREFTKLYNVFILHEYTGLYRINSGLSNNEKTRNDFYLDQLSIIEEYCKDYEFLNRFSNEIEYQYSKLINKKAIQPSKLKYFYYLIVTNVYFYLKNLDIQKKIPQSLYKRLLNKVE